MATMTNGRNTCQNKKKDYANLCTGINDLHKQCIKLIHQKVRVSLKNEPAKTYYPRLADLLSQCFGVILQQVRDSEKQSLIHQQGELPLVRKGE